MVVVESVSSCGASAPGLVCLCWIPGEQCSRICWYNCRAASELSGSCHFQLPQIWNSLRKCQQGAESRGPLCNPIHAALGGSVCSRCWQQSLITADSLSHWHCDLAAQAVLPSHLWRSWQEESSTGQERAVSPEELCDSQRHTRALQRAEHRVGSVVCEAVELCWATPLPGSLLTCPCCSARGCNWKAKHPPRCPNLCSEFNSWLGKQL